MIEEEEHQLRKNKTSYIFISFLMSLLKGLIQFFTRILYTESFRDLFIHRFFC